MRLASLLTLCLCSGVANASNSKLVLKAFVQKKKLTSNEAKAFCVKQKMELASRAAICPGGKPSSPPNAPESKSGLWVPIQNGDYMYYSKTLMNIGGKGKHLNACTAHAAWPGHQNKKASWANNHKNDKLKSFRVYCEKKMVVKKPSEKPDDKGKPAAVMSKSLNWKLKMSKAEQMAVLSTNGKKPAALTFKWGGAHNVLQFKDKAAFDKCDFKGAKYLGAKSPVTFTTTKPGVYFFGCEVKGHCGAGQKVMLKVTPGPVAMGKGYGSKVQPQKKYQSLDTSKHAGVRVKKDEAVITLGAKQDVRIFRHGNKQVVVDADVVAAGDLHVQGSFTLSGHTLKQIIHAATADLREQVKQLQKKLAAGGGGGGGGSGGPKPTPKPKPKPAASCGDIKAKTPSAKDGFYDIVIGGKKVNTHCIMSSGGAWTQAATISSDGSKWQYGDQHGNKGQVNGPWESDSVFGNAKDKKDFKSAVFSKMAKDQIMITYQKGNASPQHVLTTAGCTMGKTLQKTFNDLHFNAHQGLKGPKGQKWKVWVDNDHKCPLIKASKPSNEKALANNEKITWLYLKYGERDGAEDGNKDRVMLSTDARGAGSNMLDYCQGLGSFAQIGKDRSVNVGTQHDSAVSVGSGHVYRVYVRSYRAKTVEGGSCSEAFGRNPSLKTGYYFLKGMPGEKVYCDMDTNGGGWSLAATITSGNRAWEYTDKDGNWGHKSGPWENTKTFGSPRAMSSDYSRATDFKGLAYTKMKKDEIMIKYNGQHLLTTSVCHPNKSLKETFNSLQFNAVNSGSLRCDGGWKLCVDSDHRCRVTKYNTRSGEQSLVNGKKVNWMFLKWGEREGAEDGNKDRVKISTNARGAGSNMLDYCQGLGSFAQIGKDASANVGIQHDGAVAAAPGKNYEIFVRSAWVAPKAKSCADLKGKKTGYYVLSGYDKSEKVYCNMDLDGGGWTLAAQITSAGSRWTYSDAHGDRGHLASSWESSNVFGNARTTADYKSSVFNKMPKSRIMIVFTDTRGRKATGGRILTTGTCKPGKSMKTMFNYLKFNAHKGINCNGGWKKCVDKDHKCPLTASQHYSGEVSLVNGEKIKELFLKWGERNGAEDGNKDRVYLSTNARGAGNNMLDYCQGLGSYARIGGQKSANVGIQHDSAVAAPAGLLYEIYIK